MNRTNQRQRRIRFEEAYYLYLKALAESKRMGVYEITEQVIAEFASHIQDKGLSNVDMVKPTAHEKLKSLWISDTQIEKIIRPLSEKKGVSEAVFIYTAFTLFAKKNYNKH